VDSTHHPPKLTILVVDDEAALRSFAGLLLQDLGYSALLAESGRRAVQLLLQDPEAVAAVLLDMTMPGMTPEETFRHLREICPDLPVVILSGDLETAVRERFSAGTIAGFVAKPYTEIDLETGLAEALSQRRGVERCLPASAEFKLARLPQEELDKMKDDYLATCHLDLVRMAGMLKSRDFDALETMGHSLKGSGGCFGLPQLTQLGRALEDHAKALDAVSCGKQLEALKQYLAVFLPG